ncbi:hypothetical protein RN001_014039 [Aquatica leii]|uniref:Bee-milk protein n=1 Tax=Aquatica leii TaxID=1421715 RepID=A0AAN7SEA6_9COLE|nr:hypothetical protein RN001_014039 [Aquatica leii]
MNYKMFRRHRHIHQTCVNCIQVCNMVLKYILLVAINVICITAVCEKDYHQTIEWVGGPFEWSDKSVQSLFKSTGRYTNKNIIGLKAQCYGDWAYVAMPRLRSGNPVTLAQVSLKPTGTDAILKPFPCWISQEEQNCQALQSVVDVYVDVQGVLWALDVGVCNVLEKTPVRHCPPKVVAYSLKTGKLLKTIDLSGLVSQGSRLQYIACEYPKDQKPIIYVSDGATRSILVYDVLGNKGYRVVLPQAVSQGCTKRDVLYISLVRKGCGNNYIIFTYLGGKRMFSIRTDYLRSGSANGRIVDLGVKKDRLVMLGTDLGSAAFFRYEGSPEIYRWDTNTCFKPENFLVVYKSDPCFLVTQVMADVKHQQMRVLESNFGDYVQHTVGCGATQQINVMSGKA